MGAPGEKKKTIMQFMTWESHFNHVWVIGIQMKGYHVFLYAPLLGSWFWFLFKMLIYACVKGPWVNCRQCMARTGVGGEHVSFSIVFGLFFRPLLHMIGWVRDNGAQMRQSMYWGWFWYFKEEEKKRKTLLLASLYVFITQCNKLYFQYSCHCVISYREECSPFIWLKHERLK